MSIPNQGKNRKKKSLENGTAKQAVKGRVQKQLTKSMWVISKASDPVAVNTP